jgi:outer membrane receptor protein involved in Fe transport
MKKLFLTMFALTMTLSSWAQSSFSVTGNVLDEKSEALPFANVLLLSSADSSLSKAMASELDGSFAIEISKSGNYFVKISSVGYEDFLSPKFQLNKESSNFKFQPIKLIQSTNALDEVKVVAKKPFIEQQIDRTVVNVENSIVASGNTALEILEKAPGVVIDRQNNAIKLKNKNGVLVQIDGRKSYLSQDALMQMLSNMNSDEITSIEIITNPSSRYDASGNSGIINIKLKKNKAFGTNGTLSLSAGDAFVPNSTDDLYRGSANLTLNHRNEKVNVFGSANLSRNAFYNDNTLIRSTNFEGLKSQFDQNSKRFGNGIYSSTRLGADYFASDKTTYGIMLDANNWNGQMVSNGLTKITEIQDAVETASSLVPTSNRDMNDWNYTGNFNIKHNFNENGKEMMFDADYSGFRNYAFQSFDTRFFDGSQNQTNTLIQRNTTPTDIDIFAAKVDFTIPTESKYKFEFGAKTSFVKTDNDFRFDVENDGIWTADPGKTNHFVYTEFVNAAYFNVGKQWDKIGFQTGLRAEHTKSEGNSLTLSEVVPRSYLSLFPTAFLNQKVNDKNSLRYSYSRRIGRPNYQQLNPFLFFLDPYTFQKGNEFLKPQFTDNAELTYSYDNKISMTLGYAFTKDNMFDVIEQDDETRVTYQTNTNLEKVKNYSANLSFPISVAKWWNMHNNFNLYYTRYQDSNLSGGVLDVSQTAFNFYTGSTFTLKNDWSAEANMWFNSPQVLGIITQTKPQYAVNAGIQKSFWEKKGRLKLNISDIFLTSFFNGDIDYQNIDMTVKSRWTSRRATLNFTYNFGNQNVKGNRKRSTATEDLKQRAGGNSN